MQVLHPHKATGKIQLFGYSMVKKPIVQNLDWNPSANRYSHRQTELEEHCWFDVNYTELELDTV
jgi:hypothetical protein